MGKAVPWPSQAFLHYPALPQALWGALNPDRLLFKTRGSWGSSEHHQGPGIRQGQCSTSPAWACLGCGCAGATPCPLPALVALLGWLCHKTIPVYVTGSQSQARGALERSLWICNFVLSILMPHLIFHSPGNAFLCQRQRLAGGSATDIYIIRLGSRACAQRGEQGSSCAPTGNTGLAKTSGT